MFVCLEMSGIKNDQKILCSVNFVSGVFFKLFFKLLLLLLLLIYSTHVYCSTDILDTFLSGLFTIVLVILGLLPQSCSMCIYTLDNATEQKGWLSLNSRWRRLKVDPLHVFMWACVMDMCVPLLESMSIVIVCISWVCPCVSV